MKFNQVMRTVDVHINSKNAKRKYVVVMRGLPGSGKSHFIRTTIPYSVAVSADDFFVTDGKYQFDITKLNLAHKACLRNFDKLLNKQLLGTNTLVVDNTGTTVVEIAPYVQLALAHGHSVIIATILERPETAHAQNTHGVPLVAIQAMHKRMQPFYDELPPWWNTEELVLAEKAIDGEWNIVTPVDWLE